MNNNKTVIPLGVATPSFSNLFVLPFFVLLVIVANILRIPCKSQIITRCNLQVVI